MEIKIDSLEDMCALMCDNRIPRKENKMDNVFDCKCGDCKFHEYHGNEWYCMNVESEMYGCETDYEDYCEDHEEREIKNSARR